MRAWVVMVVLGFSLATVPRATAAAGGWTAAAPMPGARSELSAAVIDDRIYVAGGLAQLGATPAHQAYDTSEDRWRSLAPLPAPRHHFGMAALDGRIYVSGGYRAVPFQANAALAQLWVYEPVADRWSTASDMPAPRAAHAMVALGGQLYVIGGVGPDAAAVLRYNPATDRWDASSTPLPTPREHLAAVALGDRIYVIGGRWRGYGNINVVEMFDRAANRWSRAADMPTARGGLTAAVVNGRIHVTGGEDLGSDATYSAHEVFDPPVGTWTVAPPLPTPRHGLASGAVGNRWYVVGGGEQAGARTILSLSDRVEVYLE